MASKPGKGNEERGGTPIPKVVPPRPKAIMQPRSLTGGATPIAKVRLVPPKKT